VLAYRCVVDRHAFGDDELFELCLQISQAAMPIPSKLGAVPEGFDGWSARAAQREPSARFASAAAFGRALTEVLRRERLVGPSQPVQAASYWDDETGSTRWAS
jgi:hypothetical protein